MGTETTTDSTTDVTNGDTPPDGTASTATPNTTTDGTDTISPDDDQDWRAEADKWKAMARKHEDREKANFAELEKLRKAQMTDQEKAITEAAEKARTEARQEFAQQLVDAEVKAAWTGSPEALQAQLDGLNRSRFVTDDGEVDTTAIAEWVSRIAPPAPAVPKTDLGQGARSDPRGGGKVTRDQLASMTPHEIAQAQKEGRIDFTK